MTAVSKNIYIDRLVDIPNECNNAYHKTIQMKPIGVNVCIKIVDINLH